MVSTPVKRQNHNVGSNFQAFDNGSGSAKSQGVTICDASGEALAVLPVSLTDTPLPTDASTETTVAAILAKLIAAPATEAKQDTLKAAHPSSLGETTPRSVTTMLLREQPRIC